MNIFDLIFTQPVFNVLLFLYEIIPGQDLGIAIILFTILVRGAMWPLVKKQLHHGKIMRDLQPQLAEIRKKTKGNQQLQYQMTMELYKEKGISPLGGIGLLLIQIPFFLALYSAVRIITSSRDEIPAFTYDFLEQIPSVASLVANPEQINATFLGFVDLTVSALDSTWVAALVLMAFAVATAVLQFYQTRQLMPVPKDKKRLRDLLKAQAAGQEVDQADVMAAATRRMMYILPVGILVVPLFIAGALTLYIFASVLVGFVQQRIVLGKDEQEMEAIAAESRKAPASKKPVNSSKTATQTTRSQAAQPAQVVSHPQKPKKSPQKKKRK